MRAGYANDRAALEQRLSGFEAVDGALNGVADPQHRSTFIEQVIDSVQRERYFHQLAARSYGPEVADPGRPEAFHPVKAAVLHHRAGRFDEACWFLFLYVHFGKHRSAGWNWPRLVYGRFGSVAAEWWTWDAVFSDPLAFQYWLDASGPALRAEPGGFGNHRKYLSLDAWSPTQTGAAVHGITAEIAAGGGTHQAWLGGLASADPEVTFDRVMQAVRRVPSFGRTAGFDYVTTLARLGFVTARAPHTYMSGATGPLSGTRLLFSASAGPGMSAREAQAALVRLADALQVGPEVLEDAVCNWQKDPARYVRFSG
jgi:hypothetical protein